MIATLYKYVYKSIWHTLDTSETVILTENTVAAVVKVNIRRQIFGLSLLSDLIICFG